MIDLSKDIHSLTDFKRHTPEFMKQLKESRHPLVLTVNGKAELVVQDAEAYQQLLELAERVKVIEGIRRGLEDVKAGRTQPAEEAFKELRLKYDIPHDA
jgi:PHD/YefM family antitoxin component YafN of YafNO toxin-antitoxin module